MPEMKTLNGYEIVDEKARTEKVGFTDYATGDKAGVVRIYAGGITIGDKGKISISKATDTEINYKGNEYKPIVPKNLDYAVKMGITANQLTLTEDEQAAAQEWLGIFKEEWIEMTTSGSQHATAPYRISKPTKIKGKIYSLQGDTTPDQASGFNIEFDTEVKWKNPDDYTDDYVWVTGVGGISYSYTTDSDGSVSTTITINNAEAQQDGYQEMGPPEWTSLTVYANKG